MTKNYEQSSQNTQAFNYEWMNDEIIGSDTYALNIDEYGEEKTRAKAAGDLANDYAKYYESSGKKEAQLKAHSFAVMAEQHKFYKAQLWLDEFERQYKGQKTPEHLQAKKDHAKSIVITFNHLLKELINVGANYTDFRGLVEFLDNTHIGYEKSARSIDYFDKLAASTVVGMRNELATEQIMIATGLEYREGSDEEDRKGGDFIIDHVPIDIKSSQESTRRARLEAIHDGRNPKRIIWSGLEFEDFDGKLSLSFEKAQAKGKNLVPVIKAAVAGG